jgi:hypothetical protein
MSNTEIAIVLINASNGAKNPTEQSARKHIIDNGCEEIIPVIEFYMDIDKARTDKQTPILKDPKIIELVRGKRNDGQWTSTALNTLFYFHQTIDTDFKWSYAIMQSQGRSDFQIAAYALSNSIDQSGNAVKGDVLKAIDNDARNWSGAGLDSNKLKSLYLSPTNFSKPESIKKFRAFLENLFPDEIQSFAGTINGKSLSL